MKSLDTMIQLNKQIRVAGFDDAPFDKARGSPVNISGVICSDTRFEGMLWGEVTKDGDDTTAVISRLLKDSKFFDQVNVVLTDGLTMGGFNVIDLKRLSDSLQRPCISLMRKPPNMVAIKHALMNFSDFETRYETLLRAGDVHSQNAFHFQVAGCTPEVAAKALERLTDNGNVPEALRLSHLINSAVMTGQSSKRA